jgi:hypothetical protein
MLLAAAIVVAALGGVVSRTAAGPQHWPPAGLAATSFGRS